VLSDLSAEYLRRSTRSVIAGCCVAARQGRRYAALTYKTLSTVNNFLGGLPAAATSAEQSLALYRKTGDVYWQGIVLGNLISTYGDMGRETEAIAAGREALADAEQTQDMAGVVFCLAELATLYREQGEYQSAFQAFRNASVWGREHSLRSGCRSRD
jgi:tetratricopeptide (TPR) repeat protein